MVRNEELAYLSASELAFRIRRRELSPVEVVDAFIARIEQRNPSLNAFVYFGFEEARERARAAEAALMRGEALGPLHGVPTAIKDLFDFKPGAPSAESGRSPTTWSMPIAFSPSGSSERVRSSWGRRTAQ